MNQKITKKEQAVNFIIVLVIIVLVGKLFYGKIIAAVILMPFAIPIMRQRKNKIKKQKIKILETQFKEMIISLSDALRTGYSLESAVRESYRDMLSLYGYSSNICAELRLMISRIQLNVNVELIFQDFGERSGLKNARFFAQMISVSKKTGGNMIEIIKSVSDDIVLKENVKEEIDVAIHEKKMEQRVMVMIPLILILYVKTTSPGFLDVMYEGTVGRLCMTVFIVIYVIAYLWGEKCISKGEIW